MCGFENVPDTGAVIRRGQDNGIEMLSVAVTLPDEVWNAITEHLSENRRWSSGESAVPDFTLEQRIRLFLENEIAHWIEIDEYFRSENRDPDAVPF